MAAQGRGHDADVAVVGAGIAGVAAARALAADGRTVILFEQFQLGHSRGSSHGGSRIFRLGYPDPRFVRLAQEARGRWRELEGDAGEELIVPSGSLDLGPIAGENARAFEICGVAHELLTGADVGARWPIDAARDEPVLFQADGGIILADRAYAAFVAGLPRERVEVRVQATVTAITPDERRVRVESSSGTTVVAAVVVTAGAWAQSLLDPLAVDLAATATRETVTYFRLHDAETLPALIDSATPDDRGVVRPGRVSYGLAAPGVGLKAGLHLAGPETDPDRTGAPDDGVVGWAAEWVARRYPEADASPVAAETCLYTSRRDESFVLERRDRVVIGSACSGHGFKFAPLVGATLAGLAGEALR
jgi:sarcosine oxidase